ncbi:MAG: ABC transporter permease [Clostridia bacterium]|nr:ABC transporter permease [Clostridia bacterium]
MKKQNMFFRMITASLVRRRSRMLVALLAIAVGATILSGLVTIYYDVPRQMGEQFRNYGANMIFLGAADSEGLTPDAVERGLSYIDANKLVGVAPYRYETVNINEQPVVAAGTDLAGARATSPYWIVSGEWPAADGEVLVGEDIADVFDVKAGDTLSVSFTPATAEATTAAEGEDAQEETNGIEMTFTVSGTLDTGGSEENYIFISLADMEALTGESAAYDVVELSISATQNELNAIVDSVTENVSSVTPRLVKRVTQSETTVLSKLQSLVLLVTIVVLLLTMICVATTMMAVVTERRKEVGLRKALGASNGSITMEFMGEGMLLGAVGGLLGSILGFIFAQAVSMNVFNSSITFKPLLIPITILVSILVTGLACLIPVRSATDVDPALVLKGE